MVVPTFVIFAITASYNIMKKLIIIVLLFFLPNYIIAQYYGLKKEITQLSESLYQIVETDENDTIIIGKLISINPEIRHGEYKFYDKNGVLKVKGEYKQNYPSGIWYYYKNDSVTRELNYEKTLEFLNVDTLHKTEEPIYVVENMPKFQGESSDNFRIYIQKNLVYPIYCQHHGCSSRIFIQFTVDEKGKVCNVKIIRESCIDLDMEAIRVISQSPVWTPGKQNGKEVPVTFTFPIHISLQ